MAAQITAAELLEEVQHLALELAGERVLRRRLERELLELRAQIPATPTPEEHHDHRQEGTRQEGTRQEADAAEAERGAAGDLAGARELGGIIGRLVGAAVRA